MSSSDSVATAIENASTLGYKHISVNYLQVASHNYQEVIQHTHTQNRSIFFPLNSHLSFNAKHRFSFLHKVKYTLTPSHNIPSAMVTLQILLHIYEIKKTYQLDMNIQTRRLEFSSFDIYWPSSKMEKYGDDKWVLPASFCLFAEIKQKIGTLIYSCS